METRIEMCGRLSELAGAWLRLELPEGGCTATELIERVAALYPDCFDPGRTRLCVDEAIAAPSTRVAGTERLALFPPVSGG